MARGSLARRAVFDRDALAVGQQIDGPAIVLEAIGTIVVDSGFRLSLDARGIITLETWSGKRRARRRRWPSSRSRSVQSR